MFFSKRAQGAIEYLLVIGAVILIASIVIVALSGVLENSGTQSDVDVYTDSKDVLRYLTSSNISRELNFGLFACPIGVNCIGEPITNFVNIFNKVEKRIEGDYTIYLFKGSGDYEISFDFNGEVTFEAWGAGGAGSNGNEGGGGGYASSIIYVNKKEPLIVSVGEGGKIFVQAFLIGLGGKSSIGAGGNGGNYSSSAYTSGSGGGAGSFLVKQIDDSIEILLAGGGGGGAGSGTGIYKGGAGGAGGVSGNASGNGSGGITGESENSNGLNGVTRLSGMGSAAGGGGGGYKGGGGGKLHTGGGYIGGGGGGGGGTNYGTITKNGSVINPGNLNKLPNGVSVGKGGAIGKNGENGLIIVKFLSDLGDLVIKTYPKNESFIELKYNENISYESSLIDFNTEAETIINNIKLDFGELSYEGELNPSNSVLVSENLIGLWHFNESKSNNYTDSSKNKLTATIKNIANSNPTLIKGLWSTKALFFDGVNDVVQVTNTNLINDANDLTISLWIYFPDFINPMTIISKDEEEGFYLTITEKKALYLKYGTINNQTGLGLEPNTWYNIVLSYNSDWNILTIYNNGNLVTSLKGIRPNNLTSPLYIGAYAEKESNEFTNHFFGKIEEIAIWSKFFTVEEVKELFASQTWEIDFGYKVCSESEGCVEKEWVDLDYVPNKNTSINLKGNFFQVYLKPNPILFSEIIDGCYANEIVKKNCEKFNNQENCELENSWINTCEWITNGLSYCETRGDPYNWNGCYDYWNDYWGCMARAPACETYMDWCDYEYTYEWNSTCFDLPYPACLTNPVCNIDVNVNSCVNKTNYCYDFGENECESIPGCGGYVECWNNQYYCPDLSYPECLDNSGCSDAGDHCEGYVWDGCSEASTVAQCNSIPGCNGYFNCYGEPECSSLDQTECGNYSNVCEWMEPHCEGKDQWGNEQYIRDGCSQAEADYEACVSYEGCYADVYCSKNYKYEDGEDYYYSCIDLSDKGEELCNSTTDCYWNTKNVCETKTGNGLLCSDAKSENSCNSLEGCSYAQNGFSKEFFWVNNLPKIFDIMGKYSN